MKIHSVKYNALMNIILKSSMLIFSLITAPYVLRVLGVENNGRVAFAASVVSVFSMIASLGIPVYGVKICAQNRDEPEKLSRTVQELLILSLISTIVIYTLFLIVIFIYPPFREEKTLILISSLTLILNGIGVEWFYQAIEQYDYITFRNVLFKALSLVLVFCFVSQPSDYIVYTVITVIASVGSNIFNIIRLNRYINIKPLGGYNLLIHLKPIFVLFLLTAAATIYTNVDTIMLGVMLDDNAVGLYNAAVKIKVVLASIVTAIGAVVLPRASYYAKAGMNSEFKSMIQASAGIIILVSTPMIFFFTVEAEDVICLFGGNNYESAAVAMQIIMPTLLFIGLSDLIGMQVMIPYNMEKQSVMSTVAGATADILFNLMLIPIYGVAGAAAATLIAELIALLIKLIYIKRMKFLTEIGDYVKILCCSFMATIVILFLSQFCSYMSLPIRVILSAAIFSVIFMLGLIATKEHYFLMIYRDIKEFRSDKV